MHIETSDPDAYTVYVFCDSDRHPGRSVPVMNFDRLEPMGAVLSDGTRDPEAGHWGQRWPSTARRRGMHTGTVLTSENDVWRMTSSEVPAGLRHRDRLECRKCHLPVVVREERLFEVLNAYATRGLTSVPLSFLAASLGRIRD